MTKHGRAATDSTDFSAKSGFAMYFFACVPEYEALTLVDVDLLNDMLNETINFTLIPSASDVEAKSKRRTADVKRQEKSYLVSEC